MRAWPRSPPPRRCRCCWGTRERQGGALFDAASLLVQGQVRATAHKRHLPNAEVFDEKRYFAAGRGATVVEVAGERLGVAICEDIWQPDVASDLRLAGARCLVVINASPYHLDKPRQREAVLRQRASETGLPVVYLNAVGGQDELVFDGGSLVMSAAGDVLHRLPACAEALRVVDPDRPGEAPASLAWSSRCGRRWCWRCATTLASAASPACCWA
jgi:NAD+ synthase (glutamine-hydrolysing)